MIVLLFLLFIFAEVLYSVKRIESTSEVVKATPSRYRVIHLMFDQCENNVSSLVNLSNPMKDPWFVELSGVIEKRLLTITVVMNLKMMKNSRMINHLQCIHQWTMVFKSKSYSSSARSVVTNIFYSSKQALFEKN